MGGRVTGGVVLASEGRLVVGEGEQAREVCGAPHLDSSTVACLLDPHDGGWHKAGDAAWATRERVGDWMTTYSGAKWYPFDPVASDVRLCDIAHSLAHQCRYLGHSEAFYSVAEHCILMCAAMTERRPGDVRAQLEALAHDAPEAYAGDFPRPIKHGIVGYDLIERATERALMLALGVDCSNPPHVKELDNLILYDEGYALFRRPPEDWPSRWKPGLGVSIRGLYPRSAERMWLSMYLERASALGLPMP